MMCAFVCLLPPISSESENLNTVCADPGKQVISLKDYCTYLRCRLFSRQMPDDRSFVRGVDSLATEESTFLQE